MIVCKDCKYIIHGWICDHPMNTKVVTDNMGKHEEYARTADVVNAFNNCSWHKKANAWILFWRTD